MRKGFFCFLGCLFYISSFAADYPVVKVASFPCAKPSQTKFGSGIVIERASSLFVLTSDHVVYHGNVSDGVCHRVFTEENSTSKISHLKAINIGKGLGLLQVEGDSLEGITPLSFKALEESAASVEGFLGICGFPHGSNRLFCDKDGQVLKSKSDRTILPFIREVVEVNGHNEYGMSGGGLFESGGRLVGLISHQYLQLVVGGPAKLIESSEGMAAGELIALGIPSPVIMEWLKAYFSGQVQDLRYDVALQIRGKSVISLEGIRFTPRECSPSVRTNTLLDSTFRAWGDPSGIGGGVSVEGNICEVVLSFEKNGSQKWPFPERPWFKKVKQKIEGGATAIVTGFYYEGKKYPLKTLINLLSKIQLDVTPTIKIIDPFTQPEAIVKELLGLVPKMQKQTTYLREKFYKDILIRDLLDQVTTVAESCEGQQFELVDLQSLKHLIGDLLWKEMMIEELEATVELKGLLYKARELLGKIQM